MVDIEEPRNWVTEKLRNWESQRKTESETETEIGQGEDRMLLHLMIARLDFGNKTNLWP